MGGKKKAGKAPSTVQVPGAAAKEDGTPNQEPPAAAEAEPAAPAPAPMPEPEEDHPPDNRSRSYPGGLDLIEVPSLAGASVPLSKYQELLNQAVEDQLGDLLICLGQEEQKVHVLSEAVAAFGMDVQKLLAMHGLDDETLGYAEAFESLPSSPGPNSPAGKLRRHSRTPSQSNEGLFDVAGHALQRGKKSLAGAFVTPGKGTPTQLKSQPLVTTPAVAAKTDKLVIEARQLLEERLTPELRRLKQEEDNLSELTNGTLRSAPAATEAHALGASPTADSEVEPTPPPIKHARSIYQVRPGSGNNTPRGKSQLVGLKYKCDQLMQELEASLRSRTPEKMSTGPRMSIRKPQPLPSPQHTPRQNGLCGTDHFMGAAAPSSSKYADDGEVTSGCFSSPVHSAAPPQAGTDSRPPEANGHLHANGHSNGTPPTFVDILRRSIWGFPATDEELAKVPPVPIGHELDTPRSDYSDQIF